MNISFIFPGQGSQYKGMGKNLFNKFDYAKYLFTMSNEILEYDLKSICLNENNNDIDKTKYTQPAIFIYSMIIDYLLKDSGYNPISFAGHSLGEYSALVSSKCISFENALKIIKVRAEGMHSSEEKDAGKMAAIINSDLTVINQLIKRYKGSIVIANYNSLNQTVVSGKSKSIDQLINYSKKNNIKVIPLKVSGAFHSPLMNNAKISLKKIINSTKFYDIIQPIYQNVNPMKNFKSINIKNNLIKQLTSPVKWVDTINNMGKDGSNQFIEVGPGSTLSKLNKNINSNILCTNCNKLKELL